MNGLKQMIFAHLALKLRPAQLAHSLISSQSRDAAVQRGQDSIEELVLEIEVLVVQLLEVANELPPGPEQARVLKDVSWLRATIAQYREPLPPSFA